MPKKEITNNNKNNYKFLELPIDIGLKKKISLIVGNILTTKVMYFYIFVCAITWINATKGRCRKTTC